MRKQRVNKVRTNICVECDTKYETKSGKSIYCSNKCLSRVDYRNNMLDHGWRLKKTLAAAKNRAKTKRLEFDIDIEYLLSLWEEHCGCCCLTGRLFDLSSFGGARTGKPRCSKSR